MERAASIARAPRSRRTSGPRRGWHLALLVVALVLLATRPCAAQSVVASPATASAARRFDHVVIVSFDGMRFDASRRARAPNLDRLRREGAEATNATTILNSTTLPAHSSMLTGTEPGAHGMNFDDFRPERGFIRVPTIFQTAHDAGLATAMFVSKTKLRHIAVPGSLDVWSLPHYSCERVAAAAAQYLVSAAPGITFIHFSEPDDAGHMHRWMSARYLAAIRRADACLGTVIDAIEQSRGRARVLLMVTADHGGHRRGHGTQHPIDLHIPWIAWGHSVRRGAFDAPVRTTDTAATALAALGLVRPDWMVGEPVRRVLAAH